jgi:hypothetical protein
MFRINRNMICQFRITALKNRIRLIVQVMQYIFNIYYQNFRARYYYICLLLTNSFCGLIMTNGSMSNGKISLSVDKPHHPSLSNCLTPYHHLPTFSVTILVYRPHLDLIYSPLYIRETTRFTYYWISFLQSCVLDQILSLHWLRQRNIGVSVECLSKSWPLRLCPVTLRSFPTPLVLLCDRYFRGLWMRRLPVLCTSNLRRSLETKQMPSLFSTDIYSVLILTECNIQHSK